MQCPTCSAPIPASAPQCPYCRAVVTLEAAGPSARSTDPLRAALAEALGSGYDILRRLGQGAMGVVYLARDRSLERLVAVKVLPIDHAVSPDACGRFRREMRTAGGLMHANIVPLFVCGEVGDFPYYVMEYVHGQSLRERLRLEGKVPCDVARRIIAQIADALDYAHRHGVVHRDVKPDNILLDDESGRPRLADFGIAKALSADGAPLLDRNSGALTTEGAAIGTPHYMSPEQALGEAVDGRSDIYSLGIVAYEMVAGHVPFRGTVPDVLKQQVGAEPARLEKVAPHVPDDLASAIHKCVAKDPGKRWRDGLSLKEAIAPDGVEEDVLPHDVSELLPGFGIFAAFWAVAWGAFAAFAYPGVGERTLLALIAVLVPVGFLLNAWSMVRKGYRARLVFRVAFWPPKWWGMWWPRAWRRPGDVWHRLPRLVRAVRLTMTVMLAGVPALIVAAHAGGTSPAGSAASGEGDARLLSAAYALVAAAAAVSAYGAWWARRRGVGWDDLSRLMLGAPVGSSFWGRSEVAGLLAPVADAGAAGRPAPPQTPHECLGAISREAELLAGPSRALGGEAVAAGRRIMRCIAALDEEIRLLRDAVDPAEVERLERQILALDVAEPPGRANHREMRELLANKLEPSRRMIARLDEATARRAQLADLLRDLCEQLGDLKRHGLQETDATRDSADRLRSLCREAEQQAMVAGKE